MNKLLLDPIILLFFPVLFIIVYAILLRLGDRKKAVNIIERIFIAIFLITITGSALIPFSYLNPLSLAIATTKLNSITSIAQIFFYSLVAFLLRSKLIYFYSSIGYLLLNPFLSILLLLTVLSTFWSETPFVTFKASLILLSYATFASYIASRYNFQEIANFLRLTGTFTTVSGAFAALLIPSIGTMQLDEAGSWQGFLPHKNTFAFSMALTSALWFLHAINYPKFRWRSMGLATLSLFVMIPARSGTSILMFALMISTLLLSQLAQQARQLKFRKATVFTIFLFAFGGLLITTLLVNKAEILALIGEDASMSGRTEFWPQIMRYVWEKPLLGYGYTGFWQSWRGYDNPARSIITSVEFVPPNAHNGYLEIILATGFIGITFFILAVLTIFFKLLLLTLKSRKGEAEILIMVLILSLLSSFSEANIWAINNYTFLFFLTSTRLSIDVASRFVKNTSPAQSTPVV